MKARHWVIHSQDHTYQLSYCTKYRSYVVLDGRRVDLPRSNSNHLCDLDFQLPIDELEVWCRYARHWYFDVYVNGTMLPDLEGSTPPRLSIESYRSFSGILAMVSLILWLLMMFAITQGWI